MESRPERTRSPDAAGAAAFLDLALAGGLAVAVLVLAVVPALSTLLGPVRAVLGALLVFALPGYALTAALFPAADASGRESQTGASDESPTVSPPERAVLSVGLSLAVTSLTVLLLNFTPFGIGAASVLNGLCLVVVGGVVTAGLRRSRLPADRRFAPSPRRFTGGRTAADWVRSLPTTHVLILVFLVTSAGLVGGTLAGPQDGERYTELYLLTDRGENGTLVADEYPEALDADRPRTLYVGVGNREGRTVEYTVVTELQRIETVEGERRVAAETELDRFTTTLASGESTRLERELTADGTVTGERLRLAYHLYVGDPPEDPSEATAYRSTHIWVNVTGGTAG